MSGGSSSFPFADEVKKLAYKYALLNAAKYGKAREGPVISKIMGERPELRPYARDIVSIVREVVKEVNNLSLAEISARLKELGAVEIQKSEVKKKTLPPLPNVDRWGYVKTRFAPNPDFLIHLGNARPALLSFLYAKMYKGKFVLRFEDTDPRIKTPIPEAYQRIRDDLRWLEVSWDEEYIQSLRMELYYSIAKKLIEIGGAYVDLCTPDEFRKYRSARRACPHRNMASEDSLELWDKMLEGYYGEGEAVVRVKTDLEHPDPSVIDWVAFRIIDTDNYPHPLTGSRYVVWPTYNFAAAVDDHFMGITHILRGREHAVNTVKQSFIYSRMGWRYPEVINLGRVNLEGFILSKSRIKELLNRYPHRFLGLDDPRFGTIASLRRRGILSDTIREIINNLGVKSSDATISWDNIAAINRRIADKRAKRIMFVAKPILLVLENLKLPYQIVLPFHPSANLGSRTYTITTPRVYIQREDLEKLGKGDVVRLMGFANVVIKDIDLERGEAKAIVESFDVSEARSVGAQIIQWVAEEHSAKAGLYVAEGLRLRKIRGLVESSIERLSVGEVVQLIRLGFARIDSLHPTPILIFAHV
ncbi:MAG: glutamate--tRNA ligase [Thermoprotei archaeon]|nr:MAG: glutamate--tRNA ligase [Thermoprotei archaeon]